MATMYLLTSTVWYLTSRSYITLDVPCLLFFILSFHTFFFYYHTVCDWLFMKPLNWHKNFKTEWILHLVVESRNKLVIVGQWTVYYTHSNSRQKYTGRRPKENGVSNWLFCFWNSLSPSTTESTDGLFSQGPALNCLTSSVFVCSCSGAKQRNPFVYLCSLISRDVSLKRKSVETNYVFISM